MLVEGTIVGRTSQIGTKDVGSYLQMCHICQRSQGATTNSGIIHAFSMPGSHDALVWNYGLCLRDTSCTKE